MILYRQIAKKFLETKRLDSFIEISDKDSTNDFKFDSITCMDSDGEFLALIYRNDKGEYHLNLSNKYGIMLEKFSGSDDYTTTFDCNISNIVKDLSTDINSDYHPTVIKDLKLFKIEKSGNIYLNICFIINMYNEVLDRSIGKVFYIRDIRYIDRGVNGYSFSIPVQISNFNSLIDVCNIKDSSGNNIRLNDNQDLYFTHLCNYNNTSVLLFKYNKDLYEITYNLNAEKNALSVRYIDSFSDNIISIYKKEESSDSVSAYICVEGKQPILISKSDDRYIKSIDYNTNNFILYYDNDMTLYKNYEGSLIQEMDRDSIISESNYKDNFAMQIIYMFEIKDHIFYVRYNGALYYYNKNKNYTKLITVLENNFLTIKEDSVNLYIANESNRIYVFNKEHLLELASLDQVTIDDIKFEIIYFDNTINSMITNGIFLITNKNRKTESGNNACNLEFFKLINFPDLQINSNEIEIDHNNEYYLNVNCTLKHDYNIHSHYNKYDVSLYMLNNYGKLIFNEVPLTRCIYIPLNKQDVLRTPSVYLSSNAVQYEIYDESLNFGVSNKGIVNTDEEKIKKIDVKNVYYLNGSLYFRMRFLDYMLSYNMLAQINDTNSDIELKENNKFIGLSNSFTLLVNYLENGSDKKNFISYKDLETLKKFIVSYTRESNLLKNVLHYRSTRIYEFDLNNLISNKINYDIKKRTEVNENTGYYKLIFNDIINPNDLPAELIVSDMVVYNLLNFAELRNIDKIYIGVNKTLDSDVTNIEKIQIMYKSGLDKYDNVESSINDIESEDFIKFLYENESGENEEYILMNLNKIYSTNTFPEPLDKDIFYRFNIPYISGNNKTFVKLHSINLNDPTEIVRESINFEYINEYFTFDICYEYNIGEGYETEVKNEIFIVNNYYDDLYLLYRQGNQYDNETTDIYLQKMYDHLPLIYKKYYWIQFDNVNLEGIKKHPYMYFYTDFITDINDDGTANRIYSPSEKPLIIELKNIEELDEDEIVYKAMDGTIRGISNKYVTDNLDFFYENDGTDYPKEEYLIDLMEPTYVKTFHTLDDLRNCDIIYDAFITEGIVNKDTTYGQLKISTNLETNIGKENTLLVNIFLNGRKIYRNFYSQIDNYNGSVTAYLPMSYIKEFLPFNDYELLKRYSSDYKSTGTNKNKILEILSKYELSFEIHRRRIAETDKVLLTYDLTTEEDCQSIITNGITLPLKLSNNIRASELKLCLIFKDGLYTKRLTSNMFSIEIKRDYGVVIVKLNGASYCKKGDRIVIIYSGVDDDIKFYDKIDNDNLDCIPLVNYIQEDENSELFIVESGIERADDVEVNIDGLTLYPNIDYTLVDMKKEDIPKLILFKNVIPDTSKLEINILNKNTNHCIYFNTTCEYKNGSNQIVNSLNKVVLTDDEYLFVKFDNLKKFSVYINNLFIPQKYYKVNNPIELEFTNEAIEKFGKISENNTEKRLYNIMIKFTYDDHTHNSPIFDYYKYYEFGNDLYTIEHIYDDFGKLLYTIYTMNDTFKNYHCQYGDGYPSEYDELCKNQRSGSGIKLKLLDKSNYIINCNDNKSLMFDCFLNESDISNQYIEQDILVNCNITDTDLLYEIDGEGILYINKELCNKNHLENLFIPDSINGIEVRGLKEGIFRNLEYIKTIQFANCMNIETFDSRLFEGLRELKIIDIPNNVQIIKTNCIKDCPKLEKVRLPKSLINVENGFISNSGNGSNGICLEFEFEPEKFSTIFKENSIIIDSSKLLSVVYLND